tara:strand:- start:237 stop:611 length:375 start_codon:yes stop_codon:yes gene_type:complete
LYIEKPPSGRIFFVQINSLDTYPQNLWITLGKVFGNTPSNPVITALPLNWRQNHLIHLFYIFQLVMTFEQKLNQIPALCAQNKQGGTSNVHKNTESRGFLPFLPIFSLEKRPKKGRKTKKPALE